MTTPNIVSLMVAMRYTCYIICACRSVIAAKSAWWWLVAWQRASATIMMTLISLLIWECPSVMTTGASGWSKQCWAVCLSALDIDWDNYGSQFSYCSLNNQSECFSFSGHRYILEAENEPRVPLDLNLPLSAFDTHEFCLVREYSKYMVTSLYGNAFRIH